MVRTDGAEVSSAKKTAKIIPDLEKSEEKFSELMMKGEYFSALTLAEETLQYHQDPIVQFMVDLCYTIVHKSTTAHEWIQEVAAAVISQSVETCRRLARSYFEQKETDKAVLCALLVPAR